MHFSSLEVPFSSISKIFIHPKNGGMGSGGRGLVGRGRVGAGLTGPARAVRRSQIPPVRLPHSFIFFLSVALSFAAPPCAPLCAVATLYLSIAHNPRSALESAPQGTAPILFHFFPPIFLPFYSHSFRSGPPRLLSLLYALRFCMRLYIRGHFLFVSVLLCFSTSMRRRR